MLFLIGFGGFVNAESPKVWGEEGERVVVFWNLENFFDWTDGGEGDSDEEFSSMGSRHWTRKKFYAKCDAVAKALM